MLLLEINEFNYELLKQAADELKLQHLARLLEFKHSKTFTDDKEERFGLDPWVQWVSIHTGKTSSEHGIKHLGDVPNLEDIQLWEKLSLRGIRCGIWGAMNASRGKAENCDFFFPDPWTFSEQAFPQELNDLLAFPRYYSKNYSDLDKKTAFKKLFRLSKFCLRPDVFFQLFGIAPTLLAHVARNGFKEYLLFALFDLVNAKLFSIYVKKSKPDFSLIFLNSIAHLQHHKWTAKQGLSQEMKIAFRIFDKAIGLILDSVKGEKIIVANAFSQYCSFDKREFLYRQKNPEKFLQLANIEFTRLEQAMTNDGHVFFENAEQAEQAATILSKATLNGEPVFHVDYDLQTPDKVFFQVIVWSRQDSSAKLEINNKEINFLEQFEEITQRSGSHLQQGDVLSNSIVFPEKIYNHEIHDYVMSAYKD